METSKNNVLAHWSLTSNPFQSLGFCTCIPSAGKFVQLHSMVVFFSFPVSAQMLCPQRGLPYLPSVTLPLYSVCFSQQDILLLSFMCLFPPSFSWIESLWRQDLMFGLVLDSEWHIERISNYLLKEWMIDYPLLFDNALKMSNLFRKNSKFYLYVRSSS